MSKLSHVDSEIISRKERNVWIAFKGGRITEHPVKRKFVRHLGGDLRKHVRFAALIQMTFTGTAKQPVPDRVAYWSPFLPEWYRLAGMK